MTDWFTPHLVEDVAKRGWLFYRLAPGHTAEIVDIDVQSVHRRTGVGRALLGAMLAELPSDVGAVYAFTRQSNFVAQEWYEALGFTPTYLSGFYGDNDPDAVLYFKRIR